MFNNKFKKIVDKKIVGLIVTVMVFAVTFGAIFANSNLTIAADSLPGIESIREEIKNSGASYRILEIVPDRNAAEFGYLIGGQEPLSATDLYDSANGSWRSWQEFLTLHTEDWDSATRTQYVEDLAAANTAYVNYGSQSADKPMWYVPYQEVDESYAGDKNVLYGGNTPVVGWLVKNDDMSSKGWNVKFEQTDDGLTLDEYVASDKPYYMVDTATVTDIDATLLQAGSTYPLEWYVYKVDASGVYTPAMTVAQLYEACEADTGLYLTVGEYKIVNFKLFTQTDVALGPWIYEVEDYSYVQSEAQYIIETPAVGNNKGHHWVKPSVNIYYTGGFYSNEWFKQYTLDIDADKVANYNVEVVTMTAGELGQGMSQSELASFLTTIDFIYINPGNSTYKYVHNNSDYDLDDEAVRLIFEEICNKKIPCIVDYSLRQQGIDNTDFSDTFVHALAVMLMQKDYRSLLSTDGTLTAQFSSVAQWVNTIDNTNNHNYVNDNVMVINSTIAGYDLLDNYHTTKYSETEVNKAYGVILSEIQVENMYREADQASGYAPLSTDIYKSTVVRYIMNFTMQRQSSKKTVLNVLEIQPANIQYPDNSSKDGAVAETELTPKRVKTWLGVTDNSVTVNITTMNSIEFIGTIEDLNTEYDLIYIGGDIYGFQTRSSSTMGRVVPDYYGSNMDYLIYSNVGGQTPVNGQFSGHLNSDWVSSDTVKKTTVARYNGNDITADKHNALVDFVKGTYPVVVADVLCEDTTKPDGDTVDNCSYLYSFLKEHLKDENVFKASEVESGKDANFKFYANRAKLSIGEKVVAGEESNVKNGTAFVQPGSYDLTDHTEKHVTYISKEGSKYYLKYKFTITNNGAVLGNTTYTAALYLDSNSDGKFSLEFEGIDDITLTHVASGATVRNGDLVAGEQYMLTREVPENFGGLLTWKVEVSQTSNKFIRDSITGYTRLNGTEKVKIKVLQVRRDGGNPLVLQTAIGNSKGTGNNNTLSSLVWGGYCTKDGVTYEGIADKYEFHFTTMTNKQFNEAYANDSLNLMSYDMLVLGFYDSYNLRSGTETDINYNSVNGPDGIKEFIDSGKSVLFAHDTTSVTIVPDYKKVKVEGTNNGKIYDASGVTCSVWGYYLNVYIRDMVGLDTYGITLTQKNSIDYTPVKSGKDLSTTKEGKALMKALENTLDENGYYKIGLKQLAYVPRSNKTKTVPETQGFCYGWMDWHWRNGDSVLYRSVRSKYNTDRAERVNEGAITTFPYYLDETIDITRTHHQYFTLDLNTDDDGDGETDLVVWYTMGGKEGDKSHMDKDFSSNNNTTYWSTKDANMDNTSEKDVMNNYYIYNKGNITYTGFGDFDTAGWRDKAVIVEECKLFVNTLVAAYNSAPKDPVTSIYDSATSEEPVEAFYEYGDAENGVAFRQTSQKMYFIINDLNVIRGEKVATAEYYVELDSSVSVSPNAKGEFTYTAGGKTYKGKQIKVDDVTGNYLILKDLETYTVGGNSVQANDLDCGVMYYVEIPTTVFDIPGVEGQHINTFMVASKTLLQKKGSLTGKVTTEVRGPIYKKVEFVHVELFPLD